MNWQPAAPARDSLAGAVGWQESYSSATSNEECEIRCALLPASRQTSQSFVPDTSSSLPKLSMFTSWHMFCFIYRPLRRHEERSFLLAFSVRMTTLLCGQPSMPILPIFHWLQVKGRL